MIAMWWGSEENMKLGHWKKKIITTGHISGIANVEAYQESRKSELGRVV